MEEELTMSYIAIRMPMPWVAAQNHACRPHHQFQHGRQHTGRRRDTFDPHTSRYHLGTEMWGSQSSRIVWWSSSYSGVLRIKLLWFFFGGAMKAERFVLSKSQLFKYGKFRLVCHVLFVGLIFFFDLKYFSRHYGDNLVVQRYALLEDHSGTNYVSFSWLPSGDSCC